jgi:hypothetical protein
VYIEVAPAGRSVRRSAPRAVRSQSGRRSPSGSTSKANASGQNGQRAVGGAVVDVRRISRGLRKSDGEQRGGRWPKRSPAPRCAPERSRVMPGTEHPAQRQDVLSRARPSQVRLFDERTRSSSAQGREVVRSRNMPKGDGGARRPRTTTRNRSRETAPSESRTSVCLERPRPACRTAAGRPLLQPARGTRGASDDRLAGTKSDVTVQVVQRGGPGAAATACESST